MGLYDIDIETCGFDVARMADMIISVSASAPGTGSLVMHQAKGRGMRTPPEPPRMELTYKRRHKRQTLKAFPFSVLARHTPKGFDAAAKAWCIEAFGDRNWNTGWVSIGDGSGYGYFFKQKSHAVMFMLMFKAWQP